MFKNYYNQSIKKLVIVFGNLFNEIYIQKEKENSITERIRVPLIYSSKEKFYKRLKESSSISDNVKNQITLPRMAFVLSNVAYDPARNLNRNNVRIVQDSVGTKYTIGEVVPYAFTFELSTFTKNVDDNLQIMEQILPYFRPELVVKIKFNKVYENVDVPFTLDSTTLIEDYEGTLEERRTIISTYSFTAKSYLYGPVDDPNTILTADVQNIEFNFQ